MPLATAPSGEQGASDFATPADRTGCLRWCQQLTLKPRVCSWGSHRINPLGHPLVDVIASGALKRPDIEARGAEGNSRQHRCCLARWTWRSGMGEHDCTPSSGGESTPELSVTGSCRVGAVMEPALNFRDSAAVLFCSHFKIIDASPANDAPGFKSGQLLETGAAEARGNDQTRFISSRSNRPEQAHFSPGSLGRFTHQTLRGEHVTGRGNDNTVFR